VLKTVKRTFSLQTVV